MATAERDHEAIEQAIAAWPVEEQIALARQILERASKPAPPQPTERSTWEALYGIASTGQEPPSDEQVAQWLDERRMNKYGR
jgi:hypothetical protein